MATTTNYSWSTPDDTALVKDGASAIRTLGSSIDTTVFANANAAIAKTIVDAKGDLIAATAADTVARLAVGTNGQFLKANSSTATGLEWAAASSAVIQIVIGSTATQKDTSSATYADSNLSATITPTSASSRILVMFNQNGLNRDNNSYQTYGNLRLLRGATTLISIIDRNIAESNNTQQLNVGGVSHYYIDSPATTSATTYKTQVANPSTAGVFSCQYAGAYSEMILMEIV
jgi:hypothetical protein